MPSTVFHAKEPDQSSKNVGGKDSKNFTGDVFFETIHKLECKHGDFSEGVIVHVHFMPCARTAWHTHEKGQILRVLKGSGWVCDKGEKPQRITVGDVVYAKAGTTHWHGADDGSEMMHMAISFGETKWDLGKVTDTEYNEKGT